MLGKIARVTSRPPSRAKPAEQAQRWWDEAKDARRFHRVPADVPATLVSTALGRVGATVTNLSQGGCRIRTRARCHDGAHLVLKIDAIGPKAVTVAWHRGEDVGLAFADPLSWTVLAAIVFADPVTAADDGTI